MLASRPMTCFAINTQVCPARRVSACLWIVIFFDLAGVTVVTLKVPVPPKTRPVIDIARHKALWVVEQPLHRIIPRLFPNIPIGRQHLNAPPIERGQIPLRIPVSDCVFNGIDFPFPVRAIRLHKIGPAQHKHPRSHALISICIVPRKISPYSLDRRHLH